MPPCPFKVLSIPKTATVNEIKLAYRKLAMQLHPDRNGGDHAKSEQFKAVSAAYETLANPTERKRYESEKMWQQQWPPGFRNHPQWNGGFRSGVGQSNAAVNEEDSHFGVNVDEYDFNGPETIIFTETSRGRVHVSRTTKRQPKGKKYSRGDFDDIMDTSDEYSHNVRHAQSPISMNKSKKYSPGNSEKGKFNFPQRGNGIRIDSDCIVS